MPPWSTPRLDSALETHPPSPSSGEGRPIRARRPRAADAPGAPVKLSVLSLFVATPVLAFAAQAHAGGASDAAPALGYAPPVAAQTVSGTAAPTDPTQPPSAAAPTATVTVGGTTTPATTDAPPAAPETEKAPEKSWIDNFAGSSVFTQTGTTLSTLVKSYNGNYNPTVQTFTSFSPRYKINKNFQLRGRIAATYEWTNSDSTTYAHELELSDTNVQLFYQGVKGFDLGGGVKLKLSPFLGAGLPTSKQSRYRTMFVSPSLGVQAALPIEKLFGGEWMIIANTIFTHPFYRYTNGVIQNGPENATLDSVRTENAGNIAATGSSQRLGAGPGNMANSLSWTAIVVAEYGKFSPGAFMLGSSQFYYTPKATPGLSASTDPPNVRNSTFFAAWLDYHFNDWLTPEVGYQQFRSSLAADGKFGNPFFSKYQDATVYLGANIQLDSLYKALSGSQGAAGVVRAKNNTPIRFY